LINKKTERNISFKVNLLSIGLAITAVCLFIYLFISINKSVTEIVSIITGGVVSTTFLVHMFNYDLNYQSLKNKIETDDRKFEYDKKFNTFKFCNEWYAPSMIKLQVDVRPFVVIKGDKEMNYVAKYKEIVDNKETYTAIISMLNFFESLSLSINAELLDEDLAKRYFYSLVKHYYFGLDWFMKMRRQERQTNKIFQEFEKLFENWTK
jgi:Domain of unknown function (DUF4760)